jgi:hypothetical protein
MNEHGKYVQLVDAALHVQKALYELCNIFKSIMHMTYHEFYIHECFHIFLELGNWFWNNRVQW